MSTERPVLAARGGTLRCKGWRQEALMRMLENVLEVGERPADLIVYASLGKAARDWTSYRRIVSLLKNLADDETLLLQSGRPVGVFRTTSDAPMVLSACNNMVGSWQTPDRFYALAEAGLTIWGGLTAGAWQYIGMQGVLQGTYEVLRAVAREHFDGDLAGRWLLTAGLGGMGSSQPLAATMAGAASLTVEVNPEKLSRAQDNGWLHKVTDSIDAAVTAVTAAAKERRPRAIGLLANAGEVVPELVTRGVIPDIVTDQTAAHDARFGYLPSGLPLDEWEAARAADPQALESRARSTMARHVRALLALQAAGSVVFENGNNLRAQARDAGVTDAFAIRGFMERYLRPLFCRGIGPFRWVALSGDMADLAKLDDIAASIVPERPEVRRWIELARAQVPVQGLPARSCWLGHQERARMADAVNNAVASGEISAPVLFSRDHLDSAGMTHPLIGTEAMRDGSDGISDWPILDALLLSCTGADLVAVHAGGGGYSGFMQSAGVSVVADGTASAATRLRRTLNSDTGLGVLRYAEAGYDEAHAVAVDPDSGLHWAATTATTEGFA
jgi:urocanate hydratase